MLRHAQCKLVPDLAHVRAAGGAGGVPARAAARTLTLSPTLFRGVLLTASWSLTWRMCVRQEAQAAFLRELLPDALRFAGAVMIRRIVGIAHVADLDSIADPGVRCCALRSRLKPG